MRLLAAAGQRPAANGAAQGAQQNNAAAQNGGVNARLPPNLFPFMAHQFAVPQPRQPNQDNVSVTLSFYRPQCVDRSFSGSSCGCR